MGLKSSKNNLIFGFCYNSIPSKFSDGRRWYAKFFREIDYEASTVQIKNMKIILKVKKKVPGHWMDLEVYIYIYVVRVNAYYACPHHLHLFIYQ